MKECVQAGSRVVFWRVGVRRCERFKVKSGGVVGVRGWEFTDVGGISGGVCLELV